MAGHGYIDPLLLAANFGTVIAQNHKLAAMTEEAAHTLDLVPHGQGENLVLLLRRQLGEAGLVMNPGIAFHHAQPVYETLPGWQEPLDAVTELDALPERAASYVDFVERELEVPVSLIGTGADRERVLAPGPVEALARP